MKVSTTLSLTLLFICLQFAQAQNRIVTGTVKDLYTTHCVSCHGEKGEGGLGGSLIDGEWKYGSSDAEIAKVISEGIPEMGMVPYKDTMSPEQIQSLVVFIRELDHREQRKQTPPPKADNKNSIASKLAKFRLEKITGKSDDSFWSVAFLPDGTMLLSGFNGNVYLYQNDQLTPVTGLPEVWRRGQGGMLDVVPHPDYANNGWIYLSYAFTAGKDNAGATKIVRGRIKNTRWTDEEEIFATPEKFHTGGGVHFGCRIVFKDGFLFFAIGDRGNMGNAQKLDNPFGKTHRIKDDGTVPMDNPFYGRADAFPTIWTYGNRNPQGLVICPFTGQLWETEHGPRGGDELNLIQKGLNYGWPEVTYGINYNGKPITDRTSGPGFTQPATHWTPSIAVCGMDIYAGDAFPQWRGHIFVGGLASRQVHRLEVADGKVVDEEIIMVAPGRVRDICSGPDGMLYLALNGSNGKDGGVYRIVPAD